jgi:uncharacterized protein (UPF0548 family)
MGDAERDRLAAKPLTYWEAAAGDGDPAGGFRALHVSRSLGTGREVFETAAHRLMTWQMHEGSGLTVRASPLEVRLDGLVVLEIRLGPLRLSAPYRVVSVVEQDDQRGFAYGTLPGHPESGQEAFIVRIDSGGAVTATIDAYSRPATPLARLGGPLTRWLQARAARSYLDALTEPQPR